jgi:anti-sigma regulatory factor (Ser/Thr protein kinase)
MSTATKGTVEIAFSPLPAHVRTARLVAAAVARRCGVDELLLDEVRLAVGEACSRAVGLHARGAPGTPITVLFSDSAGRFQVTVRDGWPGAIDTSAAGADHQGPTDAELGLAVLSGLVDDLEITALDRGAEVRMSWPASGQLRQR